MTDDPRLPSNGSFGLITVLDRLRDDFREDLGLLEGRLMTAIGENRRQLTDYADAHGKEHAALRVDAEKDVAAAKAAHDRFDEYIEKSKLAQAHKDGALGVTRYVVELLARNATALVKIAAAVAGLLLAISGSVHVSIQ
jgi:hypothetical protein